MKSYLILLILFGIGSPIFAEENLDGTYEQDSYQEPDTESPYHTVMSLNIDGRKFEAYGRALVKNKATGKEAYESTKLAAGTWKKSGHSVTFRTKAGSCTYKYSRATVVDTPPTKGRGFQFESKSGKNTEFCRTLFIDVNAANSGR